jgi:cell division protein ZapB
LTYKVFLGYIERMDADFRRFEDKLSHFVTLFARLRTENNELRQTLAAKSDELKRLEEKLDLAKARVDGLLARMPDPLPEEEEEPTP